MGIFDQKPYEQPKPKPNKGKYKGACNRIDCQKEINVTWYNHGTYKYYCQSCAFKINAHNPGLLTKGENK